MSRINENELLEVLWVKAIIYSIILLTIIISIILVPKRVFDNQTPYLLASSMAITSDDNLLLYDYKVYGTDERFEEGLVNDVNTVKLDFMSRSELLAVKVYGNTDLIEIIDDYIFITSPLTPELNIEYYLVKDMAISDINIPCRTFIMLFEDISVLINSLYIALVLIVLFSFFTPISIKTVRIIGYLVRKYKLSKQ